MGKKVLVMQDVYTFSVQYKIYYNSNIKIFKALLTINIAVKQRCPNFLIRRAKNQIRLRAVNKCKCCIIFYYPILYSNVFLHLKKNQQIFDLFKYVQIIFLNSLIKNSFLHFSKRHTQKQI